MSEILQIGSEALSNLFTITHMGFLFLGVILGLVVGILPGLGGIAGLTLLLPFVYGMDPSVALAMMVGMLAPLATSDTFPAVLMGIPGTSGSQATVEDGFPLAKRGEGARALGAAFTSSLFGGLFGALALSLCIFSVRPFLLMIGFPEQMMLVVFGLSMVGLLAGRSPLKGLASCALGLLLGSIGAAPATGSLRMDLGSIYLSDGISLVIMGLGLFAFPEILDLLRRGGTISERGELGSGSGWTTGVRDAFRNRWLVLRCSALGSLVGALPGLGGSVVDWIAYGHAIQSTKNRSDFGKGEIRGVIAPESANNAKEGGALMPTLLFGIPGSGSMAILLGGFVLIGIEPGVPMVTRHIDMTFTIIWSLAIANVLAALFCLALARPIARLTTVPYTLIGPVMLVIIFFAAFQATRSWADFVALVLIGFLGIVVRRFGWSRPALLVGFVLADRLEASIYQAMQVYGANFFGRPIVWVLIALTVLVVVMNIIQTRRREIEVRDADVSRTRKLQLVVTAGLATFAIWGLADALAQPMLARVFPMSVAAVALALIAAIAFLQANGDAQSAVLEDTDVVDPPAHGLSRYVVWVAALMIVSFIIGFPLGLALFVATFTAVEGNARIWAATMYGGLVLAVLVGLAETFVLAYPGGLLSDFADLPRWLGR